MNMKATMCKLVIVITVVITACGKFEYSPYQTSVNEMPRDLNNYNLSKLLATEQSADDTVTILYTGDSQRFYDELHDLVRTVNTLPNIDFMIISGDIADFAVLQEYLWVYRELQELKVPYLCAIGNHDLLARGEEIYTNIFGSKNYAFRYKDYKFLFHDTNGREYGFNGLVPDINWINDALSDTIPQWFVAVSHVPPYDQDFDNQLEDSYKNTLSAGGKTILSLHGHQHNTSDSYFYGDGVRYMTSNAVEKRQAVLLKLINGYVIKQFIAY